MGHSRVARPTPQPLLRALPAQHAERMARANTLPIAASLAAFGLRLTRFWTQAPRLADRLDPKQNSFSALRLMLALAVLISHTVFLASGSFLAEPLVASTGYSLGQYGVQGFFILSGILVTQSLISRGSLFDYARARAMRIFPALIVCVLLTALVLGPVLSLIGASHYFNMPGVAQYVAKTLSLSTGSAQLPGLFLLNPASGVVNQSLWTLKYEVACYLLLGGLAAIVWQAPSRRIAAGVAIGLWLAIILAARPSLVHEGGFFSVLSYFTLFFGTGVVAFLARQWLRLTWQPFIVLAGVFWLSSGSAVAEISSALFIGYAILWLSTLSFGGLRTFANSHDYSYGTYIFGYPVTQALLAVWPSVNLLSLLAMTIGVTAMLAFLSWELIERPALRLVQRWRKPRQARVTQAVKSTVVASVQSAPAVKTAEPVRIAPLAAPAMLAIEGAAAAPVAKSLPTRSAPIVIPPRHSAAIFPARRPLDTSKLQARIAKIAAAR